MKTLLRGRILTFHADPAETEDSHRYIEDGAILVEDGVIAGLGTYRDLSEPGVAEIDHRPFLIMPGFIDPHIHFPQVQVIASWGEQLLDWLDRYTFPEEARYCDRTHAQSMAHAFLDQLLAHGTTTACAFASVHPGSVDALFSASQARGMMTIAGKAQQQAGSGARQGVGADGAARAAVVEVVAAAGRAQRIAARDAADHALRRETAAQQRPRGAKQGATAGDGAQQFDGAQHRASLYSRRHGGHYRRRDFKYHP